MSMSISLTRHIYILGPSAFGHMLRWRPVQRLLSTHAELRNYWPRSGTTVATLQQCMHTAARPDVYAYSDGTRKHPRYDWRPEDDELILNHIKQHGNQWKTIAKRLPGRTWGSIQKRAFTLLKKDHKVGKWTREESQLLRDAVSRHPPAAWQLIAADIPGRTSSQCRHHWVYLHFEASSGGRHDWSTEEQQQLCELVAEHGYNWREIAECLQSRSSRQCSNKWRNMLKLHYQQRQEAAEAYDTAKLLQLSDSPLGRALAPLEAKQQERERNAALRARQRGSLPWSLQDDKRLMGIVSILPVTRTGQQNYWQQCAERMMTRDAVQCQLRYHCLSKFGWSYAQFQAYVDADALYHQRYMDLLSAAYSKEAALGKPYDRGLDVNTAEKDATGSATMLDDTQPSDHTTTDYEALPIYPIRSPLVPIDATLDIQLNAKPGATAETANIYDHTEAMRWLLKDTVA